VPYREDEDAALAGDAERKLAETEEALAEAELARHRHDDPVVDAAPVRVDAEPMPIAAPVVQKASMPAPPVPIGPRPTAGAILAALLILAVLAGIVVAIVEFAP